MAAALGGAPAIFHLETILRKWRKGLQHLREEHQSRDAEGETFAIVELSTSDAVQLVSLGE